jgi:hypothetical protein
MWDSLALRLRNMPSIMLWGILIWASWIVFFGLLIEEHIVTDNRASANAQRFKEISKINRS